MTLESLIEQYNHAAEIHPQCARYYYRRIDEMQHEVDK